MRQILPVVAIVALVLTGVVHGFWTGRFDFSEGALGPASRVQSAALDLPTWEGVALDQQSSANSSTVQHLFRRYVHRESGQEVNVLLVCGRPGPVSIHTPDACYGASGYQVTAPVKRPWSVGDQKAEFWSARMLKKRSTEQLQVRVFWAWNAGHGWVASDNPRVAFSNSSLLYKLYLVRDLTRNEEPSTDDPCVMLMRELLPELNKSLFSGS
jgi:hypothetical protein